MVHQFPALPLDVIRECSQHLAWKDLLACRQACNLFRQMIDDSEELQLRIHLAENAIQSADMTAARSDTGSISEYISQELSRLRHLALRHQYVHSGQGFGHSSVFQLTATDLADMHIVGMVDDFIFVPTESPRPLRMGGIARHNHSSGPDAGPPVMLRFDNVVRHFEVDAAEGALLVVTQTPSQ